MRNILGGGNQIGSEDIWKDIIGEVDTNGDGEISFEEFEIMMKKILINETDKESMNVKI